MKRILLLTIMLFGIFISINLEAHSGRTDAEGCHKDKKNGGSHCHSKK